MQSTESLDASVTNRVFLPPSATQSQNEHFQEQAQARAQEEGVVAATAIVATQGQEYDPSLSVPHSQPERVPGSSSVTFTEPQQHQQSSAAAATVIPSSGSPNPTPTSTPRSIEEKLKMLERERKEVIQSLATTRASARRTGSASASSLSSGNVNNSDNSRNEDDKELSSPDILSAANCPAPPPAEATTSTTTSTTITSSSSSSSLSSPSPSNITTTPVAIDTTSSTPLPESKLPVTPIMSSGTQTSDNTLLKTPDTATTLTSTENVAAAVLPYLSSFASSPSKMSLLEGLVSSLQNIMDNQSVAMSDLRTQLQEIQDALNRVQNKREYMTKEERQVLQNAEMMKNLAQEVLSTKLVKDRPASTHSTQTGISGVDGGMTAAAEKQQQPSAPRISMALMAQAPMTPPPTASTPPPLNPFTSDINSNNTLLDTNHTIAPPPPNMSSSSSSTLTLTSLNSRDNRPSSFGHPHPPHPPPPHHYPHHSRGQYSDTSSTTTSSSRPSSMISRSSSMKRYQHHRQSFRSLDTLYSPSHPSSSQQLQNRKDYEQESNAAFDRICSLLNLLITDASSAVGKPLTEPGSSGAEGDHAGVLLPQLMTTTPLMASDSDDHSIESATEDEEGETGDDEGKEEEHDDEAAEVHAQEDDAVTALALASAAAIVGGGGVGPSAGPVEEAATKTTTMLIENGEPFSHEVMGVLGRRPHARHSSTGGLSASSSRPSSRARLLAASSGHSSDRAAAATAVTVRPRSRAAKDTPKRLSSLFVEIQDAQLALEAAAAAADGDEVEETTLTVAAAAGGGGRGVQGRTSDQSEELEERAGHDSCGSRGSSPRSVHRHRHVRSRSFAAGIRLHSRLSGQDDEDDSLDNDSQHSDDTASSARHRRSRGVDEIPNAEELLDPAFASVDLPEATTPAGRRWATRTSRSFSTTAMSSSSTSASSTMPWMKRRSRVDLSSSASPVPAHQATHEQQEPLVSLDSGYLDNSHSYSYHHHHHHHQPHDPFSSPFRRSSSNSIGNSLRRRASFPVRRSYGGEADAAEWWEQQQQQQQQELEQQQQVAELEQVIQRVDTELDRTVETIDGLTRDLVAVATHQNWMQAKLQKSLQFQKMQLQQIERGQYTQSLYQYDDDGLEAEEGETDALLLGGGDDPSGAHSPMQELSRSLKQVAISVGKIMASNAALPATVRVLGHRGQKSRQHATPSTLASSQENGKEEGEEVDTATTTARPGFSWPAGKDLTTQVLRRLEQSTGLGGRWGIKWAEGMEALGRYSASAHMSEKSGQDDEEEEEEMEFEEVDGTTTKKRSSKRHTQEGDEASSSTLMVPPPDFEDFMAQCRLLTRTLVLPFVQLTHHAMTSQDSALALQPLRQHHHHHQRSESERTTTRTTTTTELEEEAGQDRRDRRRRRQQRLQQDSHSLSSASEGLGNVVAPWHTETATTTTTTMTTELRVKRGSAMPTWPTSFSEDGSDNGSSSSGSGGGMTAIPPDSMIRARTLVTTGLYLMHLMYWTVLFIVGTLVLDPYLAESSGRQVVRIVDQVRAAIGIEPSFIGGGRLEEMRQSLLEDPSHPPQEQQQQQSMLFESSGSASTSPIPSRRRRYLTSPSLSSVATSLSSAGSQDLGRNEGGRAAEGETVAVETKMTAVETEEVKEAPQAMTASNVEELASLDLGLEEWIELSQEQQAKAQAQVQALEDKAIQVAVHFESLRQRLHQFHGGHHLQNSRRSTPLSSTSTSRVNSRPNSMYFGTTTSTTSSLSTTSTHATLVAASQSAGSFPSLVSLNSGGGQDDEDSNKWKRSSMTTPVSSLSRSSSFKGGKLDAALPVSPQSSMVVSPTSTKVQGRHYRSSSHSYRPKVSTAMASAAVSSSPLTSPVAMTPLGGGNGRHRRLSPTLA